VFAAEPNKVVPSADADTPVPALGSILLVSAAFPPWTAVGAARWEGFAPFLNEAGWHLHVLVEDPPADTPLDQDRLDALGSGVTVHRVKRRIPRWRDVVLSTVARFRGLRGQSETASPVPTTDVLTAAYSSRLDSMQPRVLFGAAVLASCSRKWIRDLAAVSDTHFAPGTATIVCSSGPPHDAHVAAAEIAIRIGVPHVVDLRDPWVGNTTHSGLGSKLFFDPINAEAERRVLLAAAAIICNTPSAAAALVARRPELAGRIHTVLNGSDRLPESPRVLPTEAQYLIVHTGTLYLDRDPRPFLRAVAAVRGKLGDAGHRLQIVFMGPPAVIDGRSLGEWASAYGLADCFEERAFGTRAEASALMNDAAMLVAFQGATPTQVPAKVFDYVSNAAAILALTDPRSATAAVLDGTNACVAAIDDEPAIAAHIEFSVAQALAGVPIFAVDCDGRFARSTQAATLVRVLKEL